MKSLLFIISICTAFVSCQDKKTTFTATINDVEDQTKVYVSKMGKTKQPEVIDTVQVMQGSFTINLEKSDPQQINMVKIDGLQGNVFFISENKAITASLHKDSLRFARISGGKHNNLLNTYMDTLRNNALRISSINNEVRMALINQDREKYQKLSKEQKSIQKNDISFRKDIASSNPNSIVAALALSDLISKKEIPNLELNSIYTSFSDEVKDHAIGKLIAENLAKLSKTDIGAVAQSFEAPTPDGDKLSLKDAMGKLTLIDFWASWCKPCRIENPNVVSVYKDYKDKGFSIISVSLDKSKKSWIKAIEDDNMDWHHISNLKSWSEPIAKEWGVRSIPATFLVDEKGVIVAKNLRGNALRKKVSELLDQ